MCSSDLRTPNLDRLAAEGMRFDATYCPSPLCVPSRMSFMTSMTPSRNRVWCNRHILSSNIPTWAHLMTLAGYHTSLIGRMHFVGADTRHGFVERPVGERTAGPAGMPFKGGPHFSRFPRATAGQCRTAVEVAGRGRTHYQWSDEERTRVAKKWLADWAAEPRDKPFAAVFGQVLPHCPYVAPKALFNYYYDKVDIPPVEENQPAGIRRLREGRGILDPPLEEQRIRVARAAYYGLCEHLDGQVGQVLDILDDTGLADNTVVIYTSDHGDCAGEHGCWWKSTYYEASVRVPMIVRWPGVVEPRSTTSAVSNLLDVGPTLLEIAGSAFPHEVDGRSLVRVLKEGDDPDRPDETVSELWDHREGVAGRMLRRGPWKLWQWSPPGGEPPALFNLEEDPGEVNDRSADPACRQVRDELMERLNQDWHPTDVDRTSRRLRDYYDELAKWGATVEVEAPDAMVYPPASFEDDVELL